MIFAKKEFKKHLEKALKDIGESFVEMLEDNVKEIVDTIIEDLVKKTESPEIKSKPIPPEHPKNMRSAIYDSEKKTFTIDGEPAECDPNYMKYLLEYLELPADTIIKFKPSVKN